MKLSFKLPSFKKVKVQPSDGNAMTPVRYPYICPVCGYWPKKYFTEQYRWWNPGDHDICECCGVQFGYSTSGADSPEDPIFTRLRSQIMQNGYPDCNLQVSAAEGRGKLKNIGYEPHGKAVHLRQLENINVLVEFDRIITARISTLST